jgi:hypothetical protein
MPEPIFMKLDMYIMATEPFSAAYFIKSFPSVCVCMWLVKCIPPFGARQRLGKRVLLATNTRNSIKIVGRVIFYAVHVLPKESLWVCLCIPLLLIGNSSVKLFPSQRRIVRGVIFCAVHVLPKESLWICLCIPLLLLGNNWVKTFPLQYTQQ